ncbi:MAG: hypothetical protein NVS1B14_03450 [Vulcanimicrobiaceae bacterium]
MPALAMNLKLAGRLATVVGAGRVAARKIRALRAAGARVRVVAPRLGPEVREIGELEIRERAYRSGDLDGCTLAVAATDDELVNAAVVAESRKLGILCSDASDPERGDFTLPATLRVDRITIAADTEGASPPFAKRILRELSATLNPHYAPAAHTLGAIRAHARSIADSAQRTAVLRAASELPLEELAAMHPRDVERYVNDQTLHTDALAAPVPAALVCASRGSQLALVQARTVAATLAQQGIATTILTLTTLGDKYQDRSLASLGSQNVFVKELESALRDGRAAYAVHSCKDLGSEIPEDMRLVAISAREDPRDAFCSQTYASFFELPPGARVGTSSMRRRSQLLSLRPDLHYLDLRGNVDTRLTKLRAGDYDAVVLAMAGLKRLGQRATYTVPFESGDVVPAAAQGALAIEMRNEDSAVARAIRDCINHPPSELAIVAERATLRTLHAGCQAPVGVHAAFSGDVLQLEGIIVSADGMERVRARRAAPVRTLSDAQALGRDVGAQLLESGGGEILARPLNTGKLTGKLIVLPRTQERPSRIAEALSAEGAQVIEFRADEARAAFPGERRPDMIVFASSGSVAVARSVFGDDPAAGGAVAAAMGPASAAAACEGGYTVAVTAPEAQVNVLVSAVRDYLLRGGSRT